MRKSLLAALCLTILGGDTEILRGAEPAFTDAVGRVFVYDEVRVLRQIEAILKEIEPKLDKARPLAEAGSKKFGLGEFPEMEELGWLLIALDEYSRGGAEVQRVLFSVNDKAGFVIVPYWLVAQSGRDHLVRSYGMMSKDSGSAYMPLFRQSYLLAALVRNVEEGITKRSGFKFDEYKGRDYFGA